MALQLAGPLHNRYQRSVTLIERPALQSGLENKVPLIMKSMHMVRLCFGRKLLTFT